MNTGRQELLQYAGAAAITAGALFAIQIFIGTSQDVGYHKDLAGTPAGAELQAVRGQEAQSLTGIGDAMKKVAGGARPAAPEPSTDVSAVTGWIHQKGFKPADSFVEPAPSPEAAAPVADEPQNPEPAAAEPAEAAADAAE